MDLVNAYLDVDSLKATLRLTRETFDDAFVLAINAASRQIDNWYGDQFWSDTSPSPRVLQADTTYSVYPGVFSTLEGALVETDEDGDGVFERQWAPAEWYVEPARQLNGRPFHRIVASTWRRFPGAGRRGDRRGWLDWDTYDYGAANWWTYGLQGPRVRVTAKWGWAQVPQEVSMACQILAVDHFKSKDLTNGVAGTSSMSVAARGPRSGQMPLNPLAEALLCHLKEPVLA